MDRHIISRTPDPADLAAVTETFKALSDPTRARVILLLIDGEHTVNDLVQALGAPQSTVSRHLAVLRTAHLVATRRERTCVYYRLADTHVGDLVWEAFSHAEHKRLGLQEHLDDVRKPPRP